MRHIGRKTRGGEHGLRQEAPGHPRPGGVHYRRHTAVDRHGGDAADVTLHPDPAHRGAHEAEGRGGRHLGGGDDGAAAEGSGLGSKRLPEACVGRGILLGAGRALQHAHRVEVEVLLVGEDLEHVLSGRERNTFLPDPLEGVPIAGVRHDDGAGDVLAVDLDVEGAGRELAAHPQLDVVVGGGLHVDGVVQPLAGLEVVDHISAAGGVGRDDDVDVLVGAVLATLIARRVVVIGDAFAAQVEVLRLEAAGNGDGRPGKGRRRRRLQHAYRVEVEVLLVDEDLEHVLAGRERNSFLPDPLEGVPIAGVRHDDGAGDVLAVDLDVEGAGRELAAHAQLDVVVGGGLHVDGVVQPLAGLEVVDDESAACGVGRDDDVDVLVGAVLTARVARYVVVIGDAFAAAVEVLRLEAAGNGDGRPGKGRRRRRLQHAYRVEVEVLLVDEDLEHVLSGRERNTFLPNPLEGVPI